MSGLCDTTWPVPLLPFTSGTGMVMLYKTTETLGAINFLEIHRFVFVQGSCKHPWGYRSDLAAAKYLLQRGTCFTLERANNS